MSIAKQSEDYVLLREWATGMDVDMVAAKIGLALNGEMSAFDECGKPHKPQSQTIASKYSSWSISSPAQRVRQSFIL